MIFVDSGAFIAAAIPSDTDHAAAVAWFTSNPEPVFTTDFVLDEVLTLLRARGANQQAFATGERLLNSPDILYFLTPEDISAAFGIFRQFHDKRWSFTDCTSYVVMQRLGVRTAFSFDHHFRQFGTVTVVP